MCFQTSTLEKILEQKFKARGHNIILEKSNMLSLAPLNHLEHI